MKHAFATLIALACSSLTPAQCEALNIAVSASDTAYVQLYHPGFFMFGATENTGGFENLCHWTVTTMAGAAVFDTVTTGAWADQSFALFEHGLSVDDSLLVELILTNPVEPLDCCMADTLVWVEDPVFNFGNWETASLNLGAACQAVGVTEVMPMKGWSVFPQPAGSHCRMRVPAGAVRIRVTGADGRAMAEFPVVGAVGDYSLSGLPAGLNFLSAWDAKGRLLGVERLLKVED